MGKRTDECLAREQEIRVFNSQRLDRLEKRAERIEEEIEKLIAQGLLPKATNS